jgi:VanZ family protein
MLGYRAYEISDMKADMTGLGIGTFISILFIIFSSRKHE